MSIPNLKEIEWAISELEGKESNFQVYARLADLYTVRDHMQDGLKPVANPVEGLAAPQPPQLLGRYGESEFLEIAAGKDCASVWKILDELMETLRVVNPRVYAGVMRKLRNL